MLSSAVKNIIDVLETNVYTRKCSSLVFFFLFFFNPKFERAVGRIVSDVLGCESSTQIDSDVLFSHAYLWYMYLKRTRKQNMRVYLKNNFTFTSNRDCEIPCNE